MTIGWGCCCHIDEMQPKQKLNWNTGAVVGFIKAECVSCTKHFITTQLVSFVHVLLSHCTNIQHFSVKSGDALATWQHSGSATKFTIKQVKWSSGPGCYLTWHRCVSSFSSYWTFKTCVVWVSPPTGSRHDSSLAGRHQPTLPPAGPESSEVTLRVREYRLCWFYLLVI